MSDPTPRLAILNCKNIHPLFDLIEDITTDFNIMECTSKTGNTYYVVESSIQDNIEIYKVLNSLEFDSSYLDCRFVGPDVVFIKSTSVNKKITNNDLEQNVDVPDNNKDVPDNSKDVVDNNKDVPDNSKDISDNNKDIPDNNKDIPTSNKDILNNNKDISDNNKDNQFIFNLYDSRFIEMYTNDDFNLDTSHDEYKKCGYLKYYIEAKREYRKKELQIL